MSANKTRKQVKACPHWSICNTHSMRYLSIRIESAFIASTLHFGLATIGDSRDHVKFSETSELVGVTSSRCGLLFFFKRSCRVDSFSL